MNTVDFFPRSWASIRSKNRLLQASYRPVTPSPPHSEKLPDTSPCGSHSRHPFSSKKRTTTENTTSGIFFLLHQVPLLQTPVSRTSKTTILLQIAGVYIGANRIRRLSKSLDFTSMIAPARPLLSPQAPCYWSAGARLDIGPGNKPKYRRKIIHHNCH